MKNGCCVGDVQTISVKVDDMRKIQTTLDGVLATLEAVNEDKVAADVTVAALVLDLQTIKELITNQLVGVPVKANEGAPLRANREDRDCPDINELTARMTTMLLLPDLHEVDLSEPLIEALTSRGHLSGSRGMPRVFAKSEQAVFKTLDRCPEVFSDVYHAVFRQTAEGVFVTGPGWELNKQGDWIYKSKSGFVHNTNHERPPYPCRTCRGPHWEKNCQNCPVW